MQILYTKPKLRDLSQGSRIAFARQFRMMSQNDVSDKLGITGECKRRTMTRYEKGERNPKIDRLEDISKILNVNVNSIRNYDTTIQYGTSEYIKDFVERVCNFLDELKTKDYENVLIVAHSGVSKAFSCYFEGIQDGLLLNRGLKNCEIKLYEL